MAHDNASWDGIIEQLDENAVEDGNLVNAYFINYNKSRQVREECLRRMYADEQFPPSLKQYFNSLVENYDNIYKRHSVNKIGNSSLEMYL